MEGSICAHVWKSIRTKAAMRFGEQRRMATALWSCHPILRSDETWLPERSGTWAECSGVPFGRGVCWGKPVFRLTASSQLAESLARGRVQIQRDGTSTQAERRPSAVECRRSSLVTTLRRRRFFNHAFGSYELLHFPVNFIPNILV